MIRVRQSGFAVVLAVLLTALVSSGGCSTGHPGVTGGSGASGGSGGSPSIQAVVPNPIVIDVSEYPRLYRAGVDVLHDQGFVLDRESFRFGQLTTRPLASPTVFEPWKQMNSTDYLAWQSTLSELRRIVVISITPERPDAKQSSASPASAPAATTQAAVQGPGVFRLGVEVDVQEAQFPNRRLSGSTSGPGIINTLTDTPAELRARGIKGPYWQTIGRDHGLEQRILEAVIRRATQTIQGPPLAVGRSSTIGPFSTITP